MSPVDCYASTKIDSTANSYSYLLETLFQRKGKVGCVLPFPETERALPVVQVRVRYKTENCKELYLKLASIGECEKITRIDTLYLPVGVGWQTVDRLAVADHPKLLNLSIEATGEKGHRGKVWMEELDLRVDGKKLDGLLEGDELKPPLLAPEDVVRLTEDRFTRLPFLNKKILAIGECVHGTETMNEMAIKILKERILHRNCKLVLMEIPLECSFYINRFLSGDDSFRLDSISAYWDESLFSQSFVPLVQWIQDYNRQTDEKVYFLGMDWRPIQLDSKIDLFNFVYTLNRKAKDEILNSFCDLILSHTRSLTDVIDLFDDYGGFVDVLTPKESCLLRYCLVKTNQIASSYRRYIYRDSIMYENAGFLMNELVKPNETVTVFCHFGHANYVGPQELSDIDFPCFGTWMRKKYRDDYSCIGLITEEGSFVSSNDGSFLCHGVLKPSSFGSIESFVNKLGVDSCFLSMEKFSCSDLFKIRFIGNAYAQDPFRFILPKARMDGLIFIRQSSEIRKTPAAFHEILNKDILVMRRFEEALGKMKKR